MPQCEVCGNDYDKAFQVIVAGTTHTFDSPECAIRAVDPPAPTAAAGSSGTSWRATAHRRCVNCAKHEGDDRLVDRA
jgi:hypothetical protein